MNLSGQQRWILQVKQEPCGPYNDNLLFSSSLFFFNQYWCNLIVKLIVNNIVMHKNRGLFYGRKKRKAWWTGVPHQWQFFFCKVLSIIKSNPPIKFGWKFQVKYEMPPKAYKSVFLLCSTRSLLGYLHIIVYLALVL